jgi:SAM domain (Sterile alpha motif)
MTSDRPGRACLAGTGHRDLLEFFESRSWTGRFNRRMIRSGPWSAAMDVGGWLRSLGLGQYEALFRASDIDADILPELTDVDLESTYLSDRERNFF